MFYKYSIEFSLRDFKDKKPIERLNNKSIKKLGKALRIKNLVIIL